MAPQVTALRLALCFALMGMLLSPAALAHLNGARPSLQLGQLNRIVDVQRDGIKLHTDLELQALGAAAPGDPLRHLVTHQIDPATGKISVEYRADASVKDTRFFAQWQLDRLVEFHDANADGRFEPSTDPLVKAWRFVHYDWRLAALQNVQIADVTGKSAIWEGNLTGAPFLRLEAAFAGRAFVDEGAQVRPQDGALYFNVTNIPQRAVGSLYALEFTITVQPGTKLSFHRVEDTPTALLADGDLRRGLLVWGGEALLDGAEQRLDATIEDERDDELGNHTARLVLHMPTVDKSMRFVMVSGVEYGVVNQRTPNVGTAFVVLLLGLLAFSRSRRVAER